MTTSLHRASLAPSGFTLVELMVTVLVASILLTIAVSSYTRQTREARRTDAKTALLDLAQREERYFSTNAAYSSTPSDLGYSGSWPINVGSNYYQVTACVAATTSITVACTDAGKGANYLLTATPINTQTKDTQCATYTLDNTGSQAVSGSASSTPSSCW